MAGDTSTAVTTYSDGAPVKVEGVRGGFTYVTFLSGRNEGVTCKVPSSWVSR